MNNYSPQQEQRKFVPVERTCYICRKMGHWAENCPKGRIPSSDQQSIFRSQVTLGLGFDGLSRVQPIILCECGETLRPIISKSEDNPGRQYYRCPCGFTRFKWADQVEPEEIIWAPKCQCKAGFSRVSNAPNVARNFFKCCIKEGQGQCEYEQFVDETVLITPGGHTEDEGMDPAAVGIDKEEEEESTGVPVLVTPPPNHRSSSSSGPSKRKRRRIFDDDGELFEEEENDEPLPRKNGKRFCHEENSSHEPLTPFPGVLPCSNPISIPQNAVRFEVQLSSNSVMRDIVSECFGETTKNLQNKLLSLLESMDFHNHESMVEEARTTFEALVSLPSSLVNNNMIQPLFRERVKDFIERASSLSQISKDTCSSSKELVEWYDREKKRLDEVSLNHAIAIQACEQRIKVLDQSVASVREKLFGIEAELSCCKAENEKLESKYAKAKAESEVGFTGFKQMVEDRVAAEAAFNKAKFLLRSPPSPLPPPQPQPQPQQ